VSIILASASPRRKELLSLIGIHDFEVIPSQKEEDPATGLSPAETVMALSLAKARDIAETHGGDLVIAADTLVCLDGALLGKPRDRESAREMLRALSGAKHTVYTGVAICRGGDELVEHEATDVYFRPMTDGEIENYIDSGEPMDKAGAYGAQGLGSVFVRKIDGDFFNVMGLPVHRLCLMLRRFGIDVIANKT